MGERWIRARLGDRLWHRPAGAWSAGFPTLALCGAAIVPDCGGRIANGPPRPACPACPACTTAEAPDDEHTPTEAVAIGRALLTAAPEQRRSGSLGVPSSRVGAGSGRVV